MEQKRKGKYIGIAGALLVHLAVVLFLVLMYITKPQPSEESGMPVMLGNVPEAGGLADPSLVEVETMPADVAPDIQEATDQALMTQDMEETVALPDESRSAEKEVKSPEEIEAERAEEARRLAEAKAEQERREAEEAARRKVAGAFGKGARMGDKGDTTGGGVQGSVKGNVSTGKPTGAGGYGEFDLGGRSIGAGGLPRPEYNVQDEGKVVVDITVNPAGYVIATGINRLTNTVNPVLRKAAEDAAKKARFNAVSGLNNQSGTITYYFNLK